MLETGQTKNVYLTIREAAKQTGISEYYIRNSIKAGKIRVVKSGTRFYLRLDWLLEDYNGDFRYLTVS